MNDVVGAGSRPGPRLVLCRIQHPALVTGNCRDVRYSTASWSAASTNIVLMLMTVSLTTGWLRGRALFIPAGMAAIRMSNAMARRPRPPPPAALPTRAGAQRHQEGGHESGLQRHDQNRSRKPWLLQYGNRWTLSGEQIAGSPGSPGSSRRKI
jgi:hypothetical protein